MTLPKSVKMVEVGARDGLQNEPGNLDVGIKVAFIEQLADAGLTAIEVGSFVSPRAVPQMADTADVFAGLKHRDGVSYPAITFNIRGLERALEVGVEEVAVGAAVSETFSQRNANCSVQESLDRSAAVTERATARGLRVRGYVSCVLGCPYEGETSVEDVADVAGKLLDMGCYEVSLGDTIGVGTPEKAKTMIATTAEKVPIGKLALHFHDTYGQALANIYAGLELGISVVDSSVAGLGGCPYAPGAAGNVASEDVLYMLNGLGIESGVDLDKVAAAGRFIVDKLGRPPASKVALALAAKCAA